MKIGRGFSRIVLSIVLVGLTMQHSAPLLAQNDQMSQLEKAKRRFNKIAKCALTKDGCTDQEALQLRVLLGTIGALILAITGIGLGIYFGRRGRGQEQPIPKMPTHRYAEWVQAIKPEKYQEIKTGLEAQWEATKAKAKNWWQRK